MSCKSVTLYDVSLTAQSELGIWCVVCSVSGSDLTLLFCYKIVSDRRDEIHSYEKNICVVCKVVNNIESSSELKAILCAVRM